MRVPYTEPVPNRPVDKKQRTRGPYLAERLRPKPDNGKGNGSGNGRSRRIPQKETLAPVPAQPPAQQEPPAPPASGNGNGNRPKLPPGVAEAVINSGLNPILPTPEAIITEVAKIAFSDPRFFYDENGDLLSPHEWPDYAAAAVSSFKITKTIHTSKDGATTETEKREISLWSKTAAHDQLNRWAGNYRADNEQAKPEFNQYNQYNRVDLSGYTEEELKVALKLGLALRGEAGREYLELPVDGNSDPDRDG